MRPGARSQLGTTRTRTPRSLLGLVAKTVRRSCGAQWSHRKQAPEYAQRLICGLQGAELLSALDGIAASTGSACHSDRVELSAVLRAMHVAENIGVGAIRFSLGRATVIEEIEEAVARLTAVLAID